MKKGFTIIELLIVIAIIGVLAGTVAPKLLKEMRKATVAKVQHNLGLIRSRLSLDETLSEEFPDLASNETALLNRYNIKETNPFVFASNSGNKTNKVVEKRDNNGGWYYIRSTGEIYANLPDGAYTHDPIYEIWNEEVASSGNNKETEESSSDKNNTWDNIGLPTLKGKNYFVGGNGQFYERPYGSGKYVVDIQPNIGWLPNFVPNGKLTGNYSVYIDDKLVNSGKGSPTQGGKAIIIPSYKQNTGGSSSKNLKVAFEYIKNRKKKVIYGEIPLKN